MRITTLVSAAAIALATTIGSVSAANQFATLDGVTANPMSSGELDAVKGMHRHFLDASGGASGGAHVILGKFGNPKKTLDNGSPDGGLVIQGYNGLCRSPAIIIPTGGLSQC